jgi:hypothetical protein
MPIASANIPEASKVGVMAKGLLDGVLEHVASLVDDEALLVPRNAQLGIRRASALTAVAIMRCVQQWSVETR